MERARNAGIPDFAALLPGYAACDAGHRSRTQFVVSSDGAGESARCATDRARVLARQARAAARPPNRLGAGSGQDRRAGLPVRWARLLYALREEFNLGSLACAMRQLLRSP